MTIGEAFRAVTAEYNAECASARRDKTFNEFMGATLITESQEIDEELPGLVGEILTVLEMPPGILDPRIYTMTRMIFRAGMRVQRKLDRPDETTTLFWRSDQRRV